VSHESRHSHPGWAFIAGLCPLNTAAPDPLAGTWRDFLIRPGADLAAKATALTAWADARVRSGGFPFARRLSGPPGPAIVLRGLDGVAQSGLNFSSQDYLGLATHPEITHAACVAVARHGVHSTGTAALAGAFEGWDELEDLLAEHLAMPCVMLCPSGWAAGYGAVRALVRETDHVLLDALAGNCLREGAAAATKNLHRYRHLDLQHAREKLTTIRRRDATNGILLATESLFAVDATSPDLIGLQSLCREFGAMLLVDVSHDLGCLGPDGTGLLGRQGLHGQVDLVVGSLAKTFASNGGFVATHRRAIREYLRYFSPPQTFSSALSPVQIAVILAALRIVRSAEGERRRAGVLAAANALRGGLAARGAKVLGTPAPLVPVLIGRESVGRIAAKLAAESGVLVNLVEAPLVPRHASRLRMQVTSLHEPSTCEAAARRVANAITRAIQIGANLTSARATGSASD